MTNGESEVTGLREALAFALMPKVGCVAFREGIERNGSAGSAFLVSGTAGQRAQALADSDDLIARAAAASATILLQGEPGYPESLLELADPPSLLFALGDPGLAGRSRVGIVGTRHSSSSGDRLAYQMAATLVRAGVVVVSGMAFGIDAAAHRGALDAGGGTIAVLGGGVDIPYPPSHAALHARIVREGHALSEAPMGSRPVLGAFPKRNRIIAALSNTLIVVEAGERSGALITSRIALELGRNVASVPGPIDSPRHVGSNRLLAEGALFISSVDDVLSVAGIEPSVAPVQTSVAGANDAAARENDSSVIAVLNAVRAGASDVEDLARSTRLAPRDFATALATLELAGQLLVSPAGSVSLAEHA
ncbi:MAG TPA: DNA-processing protein DprA [Gemmatimonadaceae bacterium]